MAGRGGEAEWLGEERVLVKVPECEPGHCISCKPSTGKIPRKILVIIKQPSLLDSLTCLAKSKNT